MKNSLWISMSFAAALAVGCASKSKMDCGSDSCSVGDVEDSMKQESPTMAAGAHQHDAKHEDKHEDKDDAKSEKVELPTVALQVFNASHPGATIKEVEKEVYPDGKVHYEVKYTDSTGEHEVEVDENGAAAQH